MKKNLMVALAALGLAVGAGAQTLCPSTKLVCDVDVSIAPGSGSDPCTATAPNVHVERRTSPLLIRWIAVPVAPGATVRLGTASQDGIAFTGAGQTQFQADGPQREQPVVRKLLIPRANPGPRQQFPYYAYAESGPIGSAQACTNNGPVTVVRD